MAFSASSAAAASHRTPGFWRRIAAWFGRLFRTVAWEARKRTGVEDADNRRMMTGAQLIVAGIGIAVFGTIGVGVMVGTALEPAQRGAGGLGSAISGVVFYELVAVFGIWARELGARRKARISGTQIAAPAVCEDVAPTPQDQETPHWYAKRLLIIPLGLLVLLIPIGAFGIANQVTTTAPNAVGMRLDAAHGAMEKAGLFVYADADVIRHGRAVLVDHNWVVLAQSPAGGTAGVKTDTEVKLSVGRVNDTEIRDRLPSDAPVMLELAAADKKAAEERTKKSEAAASASATATAKKAAEAKAAAAAKAAVPGIGVPVRDGKFEFVVTGVERPSSKIASSFAESTAQGEFVIVRVDVTNIGDEAQTLDATGQVLFNDKNQEFEPSIAIFSLDGANKFFSENINPGNKVTGAPLLFDVAPGTVLDRIELRDSALSGGVTVSLRGR